MNDPQRIPRSPLKVALIAAGLVALVGAVVGAVLIAILRPGDHSFERGQLLGKGLAPLAIAVGAAAYYVQRRKTRD